MASVRQTVFDVFGFLLLAASVLAAVVFHSPRFYLFFCLASVLVLDTLNRRLSGGSLLTELSRKSPRTLLFFILVAILFAFIVDFLYGVWLFHIWAWPSYALLNWILLYTVINLCFILLVYESFQFIHAAFRMTEGHRPSVASSRSVRQEVRLLLWTAVVFLFLPAACFFIFGAAYGGFVMVLPFIGLWLLCDALLFMQGKASFLSRLRQGERGLLACVLVTTLSLVLVHESLNWFAGEWVYRNIPFMGFAVGGVPVLILVGWVPLVLFCLSFVTLLKAEK